MARPTRRQGSSFIQFKQRIPRDVRARAIGKAFASPVGDGVASVLIGPATEVVQFSLRTRDPDEAKARHALAQTHWSAFLHALRNGPARLSHMQVVALSGELYREFVLGAEDDPGTPSHWGWSREMIKHNWHLFAPEGDHGGLPILERLLAERGLVVDDDSRKRLHDELGRALMEAADRLEANARGDYSEDTNLRRFPAIKETTRTPPSAPSSAVSLVGLVDDWWREQRAVGRAESTYVNYRGVIARFVAHLGHDDASMVTPADVVAFKDARLSEGKSARTVNDNDLAAIRSVLGWATANKRLPSNPAQGIAIKGVKKIKKPGLSEDEARALLKASLATARGEESEKTFLARRWGPAVMAYTGARVGEVLQLRKQDVRRQDDHWVILITPEAGTVKGGRERLVPLHPHLVDLGFVAMAAAAPPGHLFLEPNPETGNVLGPLQGVKNRLAEFARGVVPNPAVAPNHGWRGRFITLCRRYAVDQELRRMITGHSGEGVDERDYGEPAGLYREICKLPRIDLT